MSVLSRRSACAFFLSCVSTVAFAAGEIESVTVSATPIRIDDVGSSVHVLGREEILGRGLASVLREVPGLAVSQQGSEGAIAQVRVRGAEANQVLVLINGVEANDPAQGSEFDFSQVATLDIERIEIVRGPQSALWGSDAMAGVIHIITRQDGDTTGVTVNAEAGSFDTQRAFVSAQHAGNRHQVKFTADYLESNGTNIARDGDEDDGLDNLTLGLSGRLDLGDTVTASYTLRHTDRSTDFDGTDFFTTGLPTDADYRTESMLFYGGVTVSHDISGALSHSISLGRTDTENVTFAGNPAGDVSNGERDAIRYQFNVIGTAHRLSVLLEDESETWEQRGVASFFGDPNQDRETGTRSVAGEYRFDVDNLHLSASARRDNNDDFDDATSWRLTANTALAGTTLFASIGESVKNPTFVERFGFFTNFIGNPNLAPEESLQWEVGARRAFLDDALTASFTWFDATLENEINGFSFDAATGGFTSVNVAGESERSGAEVSLGYAASDALSFAMSYSYLDATQPNAAGDLVDEVRRPRHSGSVSVRRTWDAASLSLAVQHSGEQEDDYFPPFPPFQERVVLDSYTLVSLAGEVRLRDGVHLTGRIENALDETYEQVFGYRSPGAATYLS